MERKSGVLDTVVIGQDDQTELHVQAAIVGGRRQVDIRIWKRGPTGFAPSRSALTVEAIDLNALQEGIAELLEASHGGQQVARVVWDKDEGRRLRAETEPFGTRYLARFGFWQRVRDTWRPADDGLVVGAEHLPRLQDILTRFRPKLSAPPASDADAELERETLRRWPSPGADWLTAEGDRVAFHPRGIRIAGVIEETDDAHRLTLRQWRREDSLWVPEETELVLGVIDVERILVTLRAMLDGGTEQRDGGVQIPCDGGSTLWVRPRSLDGRQLLCLDLLQPPTANMALGYEQRLYMPLEYLPLFGRMLAQCAAALLSRLSEEERNQLREHTELEEPVEIAETLAETSGGEAPANSSPANGNGAVMDHGASGADIPLDKIFSQTDEEPVAPPPPPPTPPQRAAPLTELKLGRHNVALRLGTAEQVLYASWDERWIEISLADLDPFLTHLRDLYYDALRGRRGRMITVGGVAMSIHHHSFTMYIALEQERGGRRFELSFPANEVSGFLDAASLALAHA